MQTLRIDNELFYMPSSWNELTGQQLLKIAELSSSGSTLQYFFTHLLLTITDLIPERQNEVEKSGEMLFWFKNGSKRYLISASDFVFISQKLQFLFTKKTEEGIDKYYLDSSLTKQLIPSIKIGNKEYFGPADALTNLIFEEYIHTETFLARFRQTKKEEYLHKLIAVLYRPGSGIQRNSPNYKGDLREPFNDYLTDHYSRNMTRLPDAMKEAILIFYSGCKEFIVKKFKEAFYGKASSEDIFENFMGMVNNLADSDVTKNDQIRKAWLYDVMKTLQELSIQAEKLKKLNHV